MDSDQPGLLRRMWRGLLTCSCLKRRAKEDDGKTDVVVPAALEESTPEPHQEEEGAIEADVAWPGGVVQAAAVVEEGFPVGSEAVSDARGGGWGRMAGRQPRRALKSIDKARGVGWTRFR